MDGSLSLARESVFEGGSDLSDLCDSVELDTELAPSLDGGFRAAEVAG